MIGANKAINEHIEWMRKNVKFYKETPEDKFFEGEFNRVFKKESEE